MSFSVEFPALFQRRPGTGTNLIPPIQIVCVAFFPKVKLQMSVKEIQRQEQLIQKSASILRVKLTVEFEEHKSTFLIEGKKKKKLDCLLARELQVHEAHHSSVVHQDPLSPSISEDNCLPSHDPSGASYLCQHKTMTIINKLIPISSLLDAKTNTLLLTLILR